MREQLNSEIKRKIGKRIGTCRKNREMTQEQLGELVDKNANYLSRMECGKGSYQLSLLYKIADALGYPIYSLLPQTINIESELFLTDDLSYVLNQASSYKRQVITNFALWFLQQPDPFENEIYKKE